MLGILTAMEEEVTFLLEKIEKVEEHTYADRTFHKGTLCGKGVVVAFSKWGKVASTLTATLLFERYSIDSLLYVGVAGALSDTLAQGDIVVGKDFVQHDLDVRPILERYEVPLLRIRAIPSCRTLSEGAYQALSRYCDNNGYEKDFEGTAICPPRCFFGTIVSGDQFLDSTAEKERIVSDWPEALCVEMEGACVAQVCYEYQKPFVVVRTISDTASESAEQEFSEYLKERAAPYSYIIARELIRGM